MIDSQNVPSAPKIYKYILRKKNPNRLNFPDFLKSTPAGSKFLHGL